MLRIAGWVEFLLVAYGAVTNIGYPRILGFACRNPPHIQGSKEADDHRVGAVFIPDAFGPARAARSARPGSHRGFLWRDRPWSADECYLKIPVSLLLQLQLSI